MNRYERFIARLNARSVNGHPLAADISALADLAAGCVILGHEKSGEYWATNPPTFTCFWCFGEFKDNTRPFAE